MTPGRTGRAEGGREDDEREEDRIGI